MASEATGLPSASDSIAEDSHQWWWSQQKLWTICVTLLLAWLCYFCVKYVNRILRFAQSRKLNIQDLALVHEDVYNVRSQWYNLGLQLRVPPDTLDAIKSEKLPPGESLREALAVWLKGVNPWPTWSCVTEALKSPTVGELQLALHLERKRGRNKQLLCSMPPISLLIAVVLILLSIIVYIFHQNSQQSSVPVTEMYPNVHSELEALSLKQYSDSLAPNNLPVLYGPFLGRDKDLNEISHLLIHPASSGVTMVNIYGAPAVGKSTLAIHIGYTLAAHGIAIRYIPAQDAHYLLSEPDESAPQSPTVTKKPKVNVRNSSELSVSYSDIVLPWYSLSEHQYVLASAQRLLEWAMGLKNDTLLILDNCDHFLQSEKYEQTFKQALKDLHEASKYLRIIVTSQMQFEVLRGFKPWRLNSLDNSSAIELLQQESNSMLTARDSREIAELVGNNPLALIIAAHLVRENAILKPQEVIGELKSNPMKTLSPSTNVDSEKVLPILQLSYKYLNPMTKICAHYLSNFPGSFSTDAGISILSMSNFTDPESCIRSLLFRSLLEFYQHVGVPRCQLHTLIKEFLRYVQHNNHLDVYTQTSEFISSYQVYYLQLFANISDDAENAVQIMEDDIHNIQELFEMLRKEQLTEHSIVKIGHILRRGLLFKVFPETELVYLEKVLFLFNTKVQVKVEASVLEDRRQLHDKFRIEHAYEHLTARYSYLYSYNPQRCLDLSSAGLTLNFLRGKNHSISVSEDWQTLLMDLYDLHHVLACGRRDYSDMGYFHDVQAIIGTIFIFASMFATLAHCFYITLL